MVNVARTLFQKQFFLNFKIKLPNCPLKWPCRFALPPLACEHSNSSSASLKLGLVKSFNFSCSGGRLVLSHCGFNLHFLLTKDGEHIIHFGAVLGIDLHTELQPFSLFILRQGLTKSLGLGEAWICNLPDSASQSPGITIRQHHAQPYLTHLTTNIRGTMVHRLVFRYLKKGCSKAVGSLYCPV